VQRFYLLFSFIFFVQIGKAQFVQTNSFSRTDGLTANAIYNMVEDNHGFLWIATDAGAFRFDGKQFQLFTMNEGLPDNEVLKIMKEPNGTIWVNTFKNLPAYFDDKKNKFINYKDDKLLHNIKGLANSYMNYALDGSILFNDDDSFLTIKNIKISYFPFVYGKQILLATGDNEELYTYISNNKKVEINMLHLKKDNKIERKFIIDFENHKNLFSKIIIFQHEIDILYNTKTNPSFSKIIHLSNIRKSPLSWKTDIFEFRNKINQFSNTKQYLIGSYLNGEIEILSRQSNKRFKL
jgi:ligand-binding sensor domain-containing protein